MISQTTVNLNKKAQARHQVLGLKKKLCRLIKCPFLTKQTKSMRFSKHQKIFVTLLYAEVLINQSRASLPKILFSAS